MLKRKLTIRTPGKLMVAGEYAVLEPNQSLIVMAVDRYVYTTIEDSDHYLFTSEDFGLYNLKWSYFKHRITFEQYSPRLRFVTVALATTLSYLYQNGIRISPFSLTVHSELADQDTGAKYGLGSSAAVVTGVVAAILEKFLKRPPTREVIFKLAAIAHVKTQGSGSGADIAASTYGGVLHYRSFQAEWLKEQLTLIKNIKSLVHKNWTYLKAEKASFPTNINVYIGWTGKPASTVNLVKQVSKLRKKDPKNYEQFLRSSEQAVQMILRGMRKEDTELFFKGIHENRKALSLLGKHANIPIETEKLAQLAESANELAGAGKLSGAGGGDCGIAFLDVNNLAPKERLHQLWAEKSIIPLSLKVESKGTIVIESE